MGDVAKPFSILIVCQANVCRSPLAEQMIRDHFEADPSCDVVVASAGTDALPGDSACAAAQEWSGSVSSHRSVAVTKQMLEEADLVLAADRGNREACAIVDPACRPRLFTIKQAAFLADVAIQTSDPAPTARWLVGEWDAERVQLAGREDDDDDIPDRHGPGPHDEVFEELSIAIGAIVAALDRFAKGEPI